MASPRTSDSVKNSRPVDARKSQCRTPAINPAKATKLADPAAKAAEQAQTEEASDYGSDTYVEIDNTERLPAKKAKTMPPARRSSYNVIAGCILSHAEPIARCSQPSALGPTLAELRTRNDVPEVVQHWVALSTITRLYDDQERLPGHFAKAYPHLFADGTLHLLTSVTHFPSSKSVPLPLLPRLSLAQKQLKGHNADIDQNNATRQPTSPECEQNYGTNPRQCAISASKLFAARIETIIDYPSQAIERVDFDVADLVDVD